MWHFVVKARVRRQLRNLFPDEAQRADVWEELLRLTLNPFPPSAEQQWGNWRAWRVPVAGQFRPANGRGWRALYTVNQHTRVITVHHVAHRDVIYRRRVKRYNSISSRVA